MSEAKRHGAGSVTRRVCFSAARRLASPRLDAEGNARLYGRETGLSGHDFELYVTVGGRLDPRTGMVMDLKLLSELLRDQVVGGIDHRLLNDTGLCAGVPPSTENLAVLVWDAIAGRLPAGALEEVELREGGGKAVCYRGERARSGTGGSMERDGAGTGRGTEDGWKT